MQQKGIKYQRINLSYQTLSEMDVYEMISVAEADFWNIINQNASLWKQTFHNMADFCAQMQYSKKKFITYVVQNTGVLTFPMLLNYNQKKHPIQFVIGFNPFLWQRLVDETQEQKLFENFNGVFQITNCCYFDEIQQSFWNSDPYGTNKNK